MLTQLQLFLNKIKENFISNEIIKITIGNKKNKNTDLKNIFIKQIFVKHLPMLSFTYRYKTKDEFKNYDIDAALILIESVLTNDFLNADFFTTKADYYFSINKQAIIKLVTKPASLVLKQDAYLHNKQKNRIIDTKDAAYLTPLGITNLDGVVKKDMQDKFKQINHFIEIIDGIVKDLKFEDSITAADMGCGKGYLTFALYNYLATKFKKNTKVLGIELRDDLVTQCNAIATNIGYNNLHFEKNTIQGTAILNLDLLLALHACDTATDDAIYYGIKSAAKVIICAPCCHKQIRKQMLPTNELKAITKHGILLERQAEIITDSIRALLLEAHGYKTKVFDFIATEHTPKNVMLVGIKMDKPNVEKDKYLDNVAHLKKLFNIQTHYLETLL